MCFWSIQISCFVQKKILYKRIQESSIWESNSWGIIPPDIDTAPLTIELTTCILLWTNCYHSATNAFQCNANSWKHAKLGLFIETTDYRSTFAKMILSENRFCISKITFSISVEFPRIFQCLISIPADHGVRQNRRRSIFVADFLSSLLSLVISKTGRSERSARALCDGADVVREAIGNQFCVRICYMFLISKCRGD